VIKKAEKGSKEIRKFEEFSITNEDDPIRFNITIDEVNPNVTKSDNESNWTPSLESTFSNLAKKPSKKSQINPKVTNMTNLSKSPITPYTTEIQPKKRLERVNKFGIKLKSFTKQN